MPRLFFLDVSRVELIQSMSDAQPTLQEVLPKAGLVFSEKGSLAPVLCKPKLMPIKSLSLEKIEQMESAAAAAQQCAASTDADP